MSDVKYKYETSGRSMVEIIGVLAIMALVSVGALALVRSGMASQRRSRAVDEVAAIVENVRGMCTGERGFLDLPNIPAEGTELIGSLYLNTTTPFGPDTRYSLAGWTHDSFAVMLEDLEDDECSVLAAQTWPDAMNASCDDAGTLYLLFGA